MLSPQAIEKIDRELAKFPPDQKRSAVMSALAVAQSENGHLSPGVMDAVAAYLGMPPIAVYEVATFYGMYDLRPVGAHKLCICTNLPCALRGSVETAEHLKRALGIDFNETTPDGRFTLREGECMGACAMSPVVLVNNKRMCDYMSKDKLDALIDELAGKA